MKSWREYSEEELFLIYENSKTLSEFANKIGVSRNSIPTIRKTYSWLQDKRHRFQVGKKFGKLTILEILSSEKVKCQCECGNIVEIYKSNLSRGYTKSCGCIRQETAKQHTIEMNCQRSKEFLDDIIGKVFGYLIVLEKDENKSQEMNKVYLKCQCNCGCNSIVSIRADSLKSGNTTSCGTTQSRGELKIKTLLDELNIRYKQQVHFQDLKYKNYLYFDFGIYNDNNELLFLIEFQGQQHYVVSDYWGGEEALKENQRRDQLKREYCLKNNIPLIEIPYQHLKRIDKGYILKLLKENLNA